jgi:DNA replication initiation complex subunit (GINS family)
VFDKIQAKWKEEREKETLTPLNEAFYGAMRDFLKQRTIKTKEEINPFVKKMLEERLKRLKFVVNDLLKIRTIKIIRSVISKEEIKVNMAREELDFYDRMKKIYDIYRKEVFSPKDVAYTDIQSILDEEIIEEEQEKIEHVAIRFLKSTKDRIQGLDGQIYGPFEPEDVCLLPKENAIGFVRREIAENIDIN